MTGTDSASRSGALGSFFTGLSGLLTAAATLLTAVVGLLVFLSSRHSAEPAPTTAPTTPIAVKTIVTPSPTASDLVAVNTVYDIPIARAVPILNKEGFTALHTIYVCSNSVSSGRVRQVLVDDGADQAHQTVLVDEGGSTGVQVSLATRLLVKVSDGQPC